MISTHTIQELYTDARANDAHTMHELWTERHRLEYRAPHMGDAQACKRCQVQRQILSIPIIPNTSIPLCSYLKLTAVSQEP